MRELLLLVLLTALPEAAALDLAIVGAGPVGTSAALRAAELGKSVALIDAPEFSGALSAADGEDLSFGAPSGLFSKALRDTAKKFSVETLRQMGLDDTSIWDQIKFSCASLARANARAAFLDVESAGVEYIRGKAVLADGGQTVCIDNQRKLAPDNILLCTGSRPFRIPGIPFDGKRIFESDSINTLTYLPKSIAITGSGIVAIEFAQIFASLGAEVTLIVRDQNPARALSKIGLDKDIAAAVLADLKAKKIRTVKGAEAVGFDVPERPRPVVVKLQAPGGGPVKGSVQELRVDAYLAAVGRKPNTDNLGLEEAGIELDEYGEPLCLDRHCIANETRVTGGKTEHKQNTPTATSMPSNIPAAPKSQYEIERDERIKRNEAFMLSIGIDPHGGGYMKQNKKKAPSKPRLPRPKVPESERRRSSRLQGGTAEPERLTYDEWSDDERPRQRSRGSGGRRARKNRLVELSEEQRAALDEFNMDDFEAWMEPDGEHPISDDNRRQVIRQVTKLVSGEGVHYDSVNFGWPDDVIFRKDEPVTMQSDIGQIIEDAREFENTHGRDHGNGWLLNHPLRKLLFYQHHLDTQARLAPPAEPEPEAEAEEEATPAKASDALTPETVKALRDAKKALDEGKMGEEDYKTTKAGLLGKQTPATKPTKGKAAKPAATTPTKKAKKAKTDPFGCPDPVTEAPVRRAKKRAAASTSLVGKKVNKKFKGYRSASGTEYFDGVVASVEDGMCVIAWEDGEESPMKDTAVQKILV